MSLLELTATEPNWLAALEVALTRPPGVPERRATDDHWSPPEETGRPRRISDDLAWLRQAIDEPESSGLRTIEDTAAVGLWDSKDDPDVGDRLQRLDERGVLDAAGFLLHETVG